MRGNTVGFVGGGNMTRAIATGLLASGVDAADISIAEPVEKQRELLARELPGAVITAANDEVMAQAACVVLAVKPSLMAAVCRTLKPSAQSHKPLIISIAAGIRTADIDAWLGGGLAVVRTMPNQAALLRLGVSGLFANKHTTIDQREHAATILSAIGAVVAVPHEADMDSVTAISGSGPAYFFLLIDILARTAIDLGLDPEIARTLAVETATGGAALAAASTEPMDDLIARVRSPGGTTAAALDSLEQQDVRVIFARALAAAKDRAVELADMAHSQ